MIEIYYQDNILFIAPLSRQDEFGVEETQETDIEDESLVSDSVDDYTGMANTIIFKPSITQTQRKIFMQ